MSVGKSLPRSGEDTEARRGPVGRPGVSQGVALGVTQRRLALDGSVGSRAERGTGVWKTLVRLLDPAVPEALIPELRV